MRRSTGRRELLGLTTFDGQTEQVTEQCEDQGLAVRRDRDIGRGDLGRLDLDGAPAVVVLGESRPGQEDRGQKGEGDGVQTYAGGRASPARDPLRDSSP